MIWHIFKKDWKLLWPLVLIAAAIEFVDAAAWLMLGHFGGLALGQYMGLLQWAMLLGIAALIVMAVHAQYRVNPGDGFTQREGFCNVVVSAHVQPRYDVMFAGKIRQDNEPHGLQMARRPHSIDQLERGETRHVPVQDDQLGRALRDRGSRSESIGNRQHDETGMPQLFAQRLDCGDVPIDNQDSLLTFGGQHAHLH